MKYHPKEPARVFPTGQGGKIRISDCGSIELAADEQVTFKTESGAEYDLARKDWGFYATPSLNGRLTQFGLRAVLVKSVSGRFFVWLVEQGKEAAFETYMADEQIQVVAWLDTDENLKRLETQIQSNP